MAMIQTILNEVTSWRSRHYAVRAAWACDTVKEEGVKLKHVPGVELIADPLAKVLAGPELPKARKKLGMVNLGEWVSGEGGDTKLEDENAESK